MDFPQKTIARLAKQLGGLTVSQRLALVLGGLLVAGSLAWLTQWAVRPEMAPLLGQNLQPEELATIRGGLEAMGETFQVDGARILVPVSANRPALLAQLQQNGKLPADTSIGFDALVKESNPWISQEENDRRWTVALQHEVERILRQFSGVRQAKVLLNLNARQRGFARQEAPASASVTLIMNNGERVSRSLAVAAARLVSGAVRGLPLRNVQVVDGGGASALDWENEEPDGGNALHRLRREHEKQIADKIRDQLAFDPKARINVQVEINETKRDMERSEPTKTVDISEETSNEDTTRNRRGGQPGVEPNVAVTAAGGGIEDRSTVETNKVERRAGTVWTAERTPSGTIKEVFAAINLSYSYLAGVYKRQNPEAGAAPTEAQIQAVFEKEKARVVGQVTMLVKPQKVEQVRVDWYYDAVEAEPVPPANTLGDTLELAKKYGPQAGLGLLAVVSLGLMLRLAKKTDGGGESFGLEIGLPKEAIEAAKKAAQDVAQTVEQTRPPGGSRTPGGQVIPETAPLLDPTLAMPIGQASVTEGVLVAREVDEKTVQVNKMVKQMADMVNNDPEGIAALLEHWVKEDR